MRAGQRQGATVRMMLESELTSLKRYRHSIDLVTPGDVGQTLFSFDTSTAEVDVKSFLAIAQV